VYYIKRNYSVLDGESTDLITFCVNCIGHILNITEDTIIYIRIVTITEDTIIYIRIVTNKNHIKIIRVGSLYM